MYLSLMYDPAVDLNSIKVNSWQYGSSHEKFNIWSHIRGTILFDIAYFFMFLWNAISSRFNFKSLLPIILLYSQVTAFLWSILLWVICTIMFMILMGHCICIWYNFFIYIVLYCFLQALSFSFTSKNFKHGRKPTV